MPNFSIHIRGEAEPRGFQYDIEEKALFTDIDTENKLGGMEDQKQLKITEATAQTDPQAMMYWEQTAIYRNAYHICEEEGVSFEDAFEKAAVAAEASGQYIPPSQQPFAKPDRVTPDPEPELTRHAEDPATSPIAGIVITNQQLILGALMILVEHPEDSKAKLIEYFKTKLEEIDGYEIVI